MIDQKKILLKKYEATLIKGTSRRPRETRYFKNFLEDEQRGYENLILFTPCRNYSVKYVQRGMYSKKRSSLKNSEEASC